MHADGLGLVSNSHFEERGCVGDQPQRADRPEPLGFLNVLRLVEDDPAALRFKMRIAGTQQHEEICHTSWLANLYSGLLANLVPLAIRVLSAKYFDKLPT